MSTELEVYDFETAIESAVQALFTARSMSCYTSATAPEFRKALPRVTLMFSLGPATDHLQAVTLDGMLDARVYDAFDGAMVFELLTKASHDEHAAWRAEARAVASRVIFLNLPHHEVQQFRPDGSSLVMTPQEGFYRSIMQYSVRCAVRHEAWPAT